MRADGSWSLNYNNDSVPYGYSDWNFRFSADVSNSTGHVVDTKDLGQMSVYITYQGWFVSSGIRELYVDYHGNGRAPKDIVEFNAGFSISRYFIMNDTVLQGHVNNGTA